MVDQRVGGGDEGSAGNQEQPRARQPDSGPYAAAAEGLVPKFALATWLRDPVPAADHGLDQRRVSELSSQAQDGDRHGLGERVGVFVPDLFEKLLGADHCAARPKLALRAHRTPFGPGARDGPPG